MWAKYHARKKRRYNREHYARNAEELKAKRRARYRAKVLRANAATEAIDGRS